MRELDQALRIARAVRGAGGRALIVGGWVRDRCLGRDSKDVDLEVYGLPAAGVRALLERIDRVNVVGEAFTVFKVGSIDVALPRRESKTGRGHRGFEVTGDPDLPVEEAARRRDFTINAIAWDPLTEEYVDPYGGQADLERKRLRAVDPRTFGDDSLRVLRAIQFAARFELDVDEATRALCRRIVLDDLPAERIWGELEKLLLQAARPSIGFRLAFDLGVVHQLFPELEALVDSPQEPEWHPEGDVWVHTLLVIDRARELIDDLERPRQIVLMLGAVCHDFGKPATTAWRDGRIRSLQSRRGGCCTSSRLPRPPQRALGRGLRRSATDDWVGRAPPEAGHVAQGARRGRRRGVQAARAESRPRVARAARQGRLPWPAWSVRLLGDGLVSLAGQDLGCRAHTTGAAPPGSSRARARPGARSTHRTDLVGGLRATARRRHRNRRGRDRSGEANHQGQVVLGSWFLVLDLSPQS